MPSNSNRGSQNRQSNRSGNLSQAASKMRSSDPQERSEGASELGQAGGRSRRQD